MKFLSCPYGVKMSLNLSLNFFLLIVLGDLNKNLIDSTLTDSCDAIVTTTTTVMTRHDPTLADKYKNNNESYYTLDRLIRLSQRTRQLERLGYDLPPLRLCGGGESSLSTGTTGWGTPPSQQTNNNNGNL